MKKDKVAFESPRKTVMKKRWVKCYLCGKWTLGKPFFNDKGKKKWGYCDRDGNEHNCKP